MSCDRRSANPGRREREAGKRHRRAWVVEYDGGGATCAGFRYFLSYPPGAGAVPLKLGRKHYRRWCRRYQAVADSRKPGGDGVL